MPYECSPQIICHWLRKQPQHNLDTVQSAEVHSLPPASRTSEIWGPYLMSTPFSDIPPPAYSFLHCFLQAWPGMLGPPAAISSSGWRTPLTQPLLTEQVLLHVTVSVVITQVQYFPVLTDPKTDTVFHVCSNECWVMITPQSTDSAPADTAQDAVDFHSERKVGRGNKNKCPEFVKDAFRYLSKTPYIQPEFLTTIINN